MPIPSEFDGKFANGAEFTNRFVLPLLRRIGFSVVVYYHGQREFGKDLVFGEIDQFGHIKYHGMQVKYVASIGQNDTEGLISDCRQAFANPFTHPSTHQQHRLNTFYAVNGGSISDNARTHFFNSLNVPHGGQIRLLGGQELLALDRIATYGRVEQIGEQLSGFILEIRTNTSILNSLLPALKRKVDDTTAPSNVDRLRTLAIDNYLVRPINLPGLPLDLVNNMKMMLDGFNGLVEAQLGTRPDANRKELATKAIEIANTLLALMVVIRTTLETTLQSLGPLVAI